MRKLFIEKFSNLFVRGSSLGSKFLFTLFISKYLTVEEYGEYNLLITSVTFLMFVLGMDFYSYTAREILGNSRQNRIIYIKHQFLFHGIIYILFLPLVYIFFKSFLGSINFFLFYLLLIFEHFSQELYRLFVFHNKQIIANGLLFLRTFLWILIFCVNVIFLNAHVISIDFILLYWLFGALVSTVVGLIILFKEYKLTFPDLVDQSGIDLNIIKSGLIICVPLFFSTISYKLIEYSDRYFIEIMMDTAHVGIYSLYSNVSNITNIVVNTMVTLIIFPKIVTAVKTENYSDFLINKRRLKKELIITTLTSNLILMAAIFPLLNWIGKVDYSENVLSFFILIIGNTFLNLSFLPHYLLYSFGKDKFNIVPTIMGMVLNIFLNFVLIFLFNSIIGAAIATTLSFLFILLLKSRNWAKFAKANTNITRFQ